MLSLTLGLIMALTESACIDDSFSHQRGNTHQECSDFSDHSELSDNHGSQECMLEYVSSFKSDVSQNDKGFLAFGIITVKYRYSSYIWQPPKFV